ncbi:MAG: VanZ family protein [Candidatus Hydrogenedentota bacterium]
MKLPYIIATALYCAGIFWISSQPRPLGVELPPAFGIDKLLHFGVYAGLAGLVSVGLQRSESRLSKPWRFWFPILFAALYGLSDEVHQIFVPRRTFAIGDLAANTAGAFAAQYLLWCIFWRPRQTEEPSATEPE